VNRPSDGYERTVTNQIFLVADSRPSGRLSHFHVSAEHDYVLAGSKVNIAAAAVDTNYIPMDRSFRLDASDGDLDGTVLTTPMDGGRVTVTAFGNGREGSTTIYVVDEPDEVIIRDSENNALESLTVVPGSRTQLKATAVYQHLTLYADPELFVWEVRGGIGTISEDGVFTAAEPGEGVITAEAGGTRVSVPVTVSNVSLKTVEDFETQDTIFDGTHADNAWFTRVTGGEQVRFGRSAARIDYVLTEENNCTAEWRGFGSHEAVTIPYTSLNLWVYGDGSGNNLSFLYSNDTKGHLTTLITTLDFTGWKQVSVPLPHEWFVIQGLVIDAGVDYVDDGMGGLLPVYADTVREGTVYIDQIVASFQNAVDNEVPEVMAELNADSHEVTAFVYDTVDEILPAEQISVWFNGVENKGGRLSGFTYDDETGEVTFALPGPGESGGPWRVTVTAKDASGNIGRASVDIPAYGEGSDVHKFTDVDGYWAADYVDFLYTSGVTTGYEDGTFRPDQKISRQQFAVMLYRYLGLREEDYANVVLPFADLDKIGTYALPAIRALYSEGIINGSAGKDGRLYFNPNNSLTRAQAATMIGRTQEKGYATVELTFTDAEKVPAYATFYIRTMAAQGVIGGYQDGSFKPNNPITRGQMAKILYTLM